MSQKSNATFSPNNGAGELHHDLLTGAAEIAAFTGLKVRRVYRLAAAGQLPTFRLGGILQARKSSLQAFLIERAVSASAKRTKRAHA